MSKRRRRKKARMTKKNDYVRKRDLEVDLMLIIDNTLEQDYVVIYVLEQILSRLRQKNKILAI